MSPPFRSILAFALLASAITSESFGQQAWNAVNPANPYNFYGPIAGPCGYPGHFQQNFGFPYHFGVPRYFGPNFYNFQTVYPYGFNGNYGPYSIYGPLVLPTDSVFGVNALPAMARPQLQQPVRPQINVIVPPNLVAKPLDPRPNAASVQRANKQITFGDKEFHQRNFLAAYKHYSDARKLALGYAEAEFRLGWVLLALRKFDRAAEAFRQGIKLDPDWIESDFSLEIVFPEEGRAQAKLNQLLAIAEENPRDANLMLGVGIFLHFLDKPDEAQLFFKEADHLAPGDFAVQAFLRDQVNGARKF